MIINDLTHTEESIMLLVWKLKSAYLKDILEAYPEPKPHQNTVSTYLKLLLDKEYIFIEKEGRIFKYNVQITFEDYQSYVLSKFINQYFPNDALDLIQKMISDKHLKTNDLEKFFVTDKKSNSEIKNSKKDKAVIDFIEEITKKKKKKIKNKDKKKKK